MSKHPHLPDDRALTVLESSQADTVRDRVTVRPFRPEPDRPAPAPSPVRDSEPADADLFRTSVREIKRPASAQSVSTDPSGFGFTTPAVQRPPATVAAQRPARAPQGPPRWPHIAVAITVPAAGVAGFLAAAFTSALPITVLTYIVIGGFVIVKLSGPVRAIITAITAVIAKIGPR